MRTIGLIGGMTWESSVEYYRILNERVAQRLGGLHSAKCVMVSIDFAPLEMQQERGEWDEAGRELAKAARQLEHAGAECVLICANTMHKVMDAVQSAVSIPLLHIADATAARVKAAGLNTIALMGTKYTMEEGFYKDRLSQRFGLRVITPTAADREIIHRVIYQELGFGILRPESKAAYLRIIDDLVAQGAQGVILGCTEIGLLVKQEDHPAPLFDTTRIHAEAAVDWALQE
ncbi:aspartate racemase [Longilinea arvoryzae]|uniref:Aspartate racemase n=1 Tax=Longilinea arvoryzae TaxID=360412 RepID=A0A0S7B7D2_9CHLR|nr:aspartate/glutamate racemase family protein [Longilinea arvoryzae]GAP13079.1 aspartate racemase [Longilinea arvoryzae]